MTEDGKSQVDKERSSKAKPVGAVITIIAALIFILSGLCTGAFIIDVLPDGESADHYGPSNVLEVLFIGAFGLVPAALLYWAGKRLQSRGHNWVSWLIISPFVVLIVLWIGSFVFSGFLYG